MDVLVLTLIIAVVLQFWQLRKQAEIANKIAQQYCEKNDLQYIACARIKTKLIFFKRQFANWHSVYLFEFSGNGEDKNQGEITLEDCRLLDITTEVYRVN